jgi:hypothetical protein
MPSWKKVIVSGSDASLNSINVATNVVAQSFTGSLFGTASFAVSSSHAIFADSSSQATSASFATTASYAGFALSASRATTSSYALYAETASYAINITVSGSISDVDYINFDTNIGYTLAEGRLGWDSGEGTLQLGMEGGNVQYSLGEQILQYCFNAETSSLSKGQVVFISGSQGNRIAVKLADNSADRVSAGTLGFVAETITAGGNGWVITEGNLRKLNTVGLTPGALLYLGETPGTYTETKPVAPRHEVRLGYVERVHASVGSIYVKIDNGYEIGELHDVVDSTTTSSYGDLFVKSGSVWVNSRQLTGSYGLTGSLTADQVYATSLTASNLQVINAITASSISATSASFGYVQSVTGSAVIIGQEYIILNTQTPAARYAGLQIYDSGSNATASIVWDSQTNHFVYENASGSTYSGGGFLAGPKNTGSLADVTYPTQYRVLRSQGDDHVYDSNIYDDDTAIRLEINTQVTGSLGVTGGITGSLLGTASYAAQALSSSYADFSISSSQAQNAVTASYVLNAVSASFATSASQAQNANTASYVLNAVSASFATSALSASYAVTASHADFAVSSSQATSASFAVTASFSNTSTSASFATNALTASYALFAANGGGGGGGGATVTHTQLTASTTWSFGHNLNTLTPLLQVYDLNYEQIIPNEIVSINAFTSEIRFDYTQAGYAVASSGGGLTVTGSTPRLTQTVAATTWSFAHNLGTQYPGFEVFDQNDYVIIPAGIYAIDENNAEIYFATPSTGVAIANFSGIDGVVPAATSASYAATSSYSDQFHIGGTQTQYSLVTSSINGSNIVFNVATGSYSSAFFKYTVASASNARSGEIMSVWNGSTVTFTDNSTTDIGTTTVVTSSVALSGANIQLDMQTNSAGWRIKSIATFM